MSNTKNNINEIVNKMRHIIVVVLVIALFLLSGCVTNRDRPKGIEDIHKGFEGLKIEFLKNAPPNVVFEKSSFPAAFMVKNNGLYSVGKYNGGDGLPEKAILALGMERDYNKLNSVEVRGKKQSAITEVVRFGLEGKSDFNPRGNFEIIEYSLSSKQIESQSETHTSYIYGTLCYPYQTKLATTVCIDTDVLGARYKQRVCSAKDIEYPNGQGAPVAITKIESRMYQDDSSQRQDGSQREQILPHFIIHVENKGDGQVIRKFDFDDSGNGVKTDNIGKVCSSKRLDPNDKDFNTVMVRAYISGTETTGIQLDCEPKIPSRKNNPEGYVRLVGKKDIVRCSMPKEKGILKATEPYTSPLTVILDYGYTTTVTKSYVIERSVVE